jgi:hypothetical protein
MIQPEAVAGPPDGHRLGVQRARTVLFSRGDSVAVPRNPCGSAAKLEAWPAACGARGN